MASSSSDPAFTAAGETAAQLKLRGTLHPLTSAGVNFHFETAARTDFVNVGCVLLTTVNVVMSATPSVSTSTRIRTSPCPFFPSTPLGNRFGIGAGSNATGAGTRSTASSGSAIARCTHSLHVTTGSGGATRAGVADGSATPRPPHAVTARKATTDEN